MQWPPNNPTNSQTNSTADQLVRAAAQGQLETVQSLLQEISHGMVDIRSGGKTALQVASHQGHAHIVKLLLLNKAAVNTSDSDGDTCLHYAAFGNQPDVNNFVFNFFFKLVVLPSYKNYPSLLGIRVTDSSRS